MVKKIVRHLRKWQFSLSLSLYASYITRDMTIKINSISHMVVHWRWNVCIVYTNYRRDKAKCKHCSCYLIRIDLPHIVFLLYELACLLFLCLSFSDRKISSLLNIEARFFLRWSNARKIASEFRMKRGRKAVKRRSGKKL